MGETHMGNQPDHEDATSTAAGADHDRGQAASGGNSGANPHPALREIKTTVYLIRHGDRFDYGHPELWNPSDTQVREELINSLGHCVIDPPLSALGHQQARETGDELLRDLFSSGGVQVRVDVVPSSLQILASPYLRVLQTAMPLVDKLNNAVARRSRTASSPEREGETPLFKLRIEPALAETTHVPELSQQQPRERFRSGFPYVDLDYKPVFGGGAAGSRGGTKEGLFDCCSTHRHMRIAQIRQMKTPGSRGGVENDPRGGGAVLRTAYNAQQLNSGLDDLHQGETTTLEYPACEGFPEAYHDRMEKLAGVIAGKKPGENPFYGRTTFLFSHAASVALVGHLIQSGDLEKDVGPFAPCGIFKLERTEMQNSGAPAHPYGEDKKDLKFALTRLGADNGPYVSENAATTFPWMFRREHLHVWKSRYGYCVRDP